MDLESGDVGALPVERVLGAIRPNRSTAGEGRVVRQEASVTRTYGSREAQKARRGLRPARKGDGGGPREREVWTMATTGGRGTKPRRHSGSKMPSGYSAPSWTVLSGSAYKRARGRMGPETAVRAVRAVLARESTDSCGCSFDNKLVAEIGKRCLLPGGLASERSSRASRWCR